MEIKKKRWVIAAVGSVILVGITVGLAVSMKGTKVTAHRVAAGAVQDLYTEDGVVTSGKEFAVVSVVSAPVLEVVVKENDAVKAGDLLVRLDSRDYQHKKEVHQSAIAGYQAQMEQSNINQLMAASPAEYLDSVKQEMNAALTAYQAAQTASQAAEALYQSQTVSKIEWEQARAEYQNARMFYQNAKNRYEESQNFLVSLEAEGIDRQTLNQRFYNSVQTQLTSAIQSEQAALSQLQDQIEDCLITAETDGLITAVPARSASMIQAGQTAVILRSHEAMTVETDVLTSIEPYLEVGSPVILKQQIRNREVTFTGEIAQIYDFARAGVSALGLAEHRVPVRINIDEEQQLSLKPGYEVQIQFTLYQSSDQLVIPVHCVYEKEGQQFVYLINAGKAVKTPIEVAHQSAGQVVVASGLEVDDLVVANIDSNKIYDGVSVVYD